MSMIFCTSPDDLSGRFLSGSGFFFLICLLLLWGRAADAEIKNLNQNHSWQYRWGDSPFMNGSPVWLTDGRDVEWQLIDFPSNPPNRNGQTNVWYRTTLPQSNWNDPVIYIFSVDLITQVYLDGKMIYQYGVFNEQGQGMFSGWPWHMISLPPDSGGKTIYFRVFSNYLDIGLWGEVKLMERVELYQMIWQRSVENILVAAFSVLVSLLSFLLAVHKAQRQLFVPLAIFSLSAAGLAFTDSQAKQLILFQPLLWDYIGATSYYLLPTALVMLLSQGFSLIPAKLGRILIAVFSLYLIGAVTLSLAGLVGLSDTYPVFDALFIILVPATLFIAAFRHHLNWDARFILLAVALLVGVLILDMAVAHNWVEWSDVSVEIGVLIFTCTLVFIALMRYGQSQDELASLNQSLELRVHQRTQALNAFAQKEAGRAKKLLKVQKRSELLEQTVARLGECRSLSEGLEYLKPRLSGLIAPMPGLVYWFDGSVFQKGESNLKNQQSTRRFFPDQLESDTTLIAGLSGNWKRFLLEYENPELGRQSVAVIWADISESRSELLGLNSLTMETLFARGVERINLALSQVALKSALSKFSYEDGLTGLKNRRYLDIQLPKMVDTACKNQQPMALMVCDIDFFKSFNDRFGHIAGDEVLRHVAGVMKKQFAEDVLVSRFGGEEFVIALPNTDCKKALQQAEILRQAVAELEVPFEDISLQTVRLSVGVCMLSQHCSTAPDLIHCADTALYEAKKTGRNKVVHFHQGTGAPSSNQEA